MLKQITYWVKIYGSAGNPDQRAVQDFVDCETTEVLNTFRAELLGISLGRVEEKTLDLIVGNKRKVLHESYQEWSKLMLMWLAAALKK